MRLPFLIWLALAGCNFGDNTAAIAPPHHACGDGVVDPGEGCDDGNTVSGDGCSSDCQVETAQPVCGNGIVETGEQCDDGNTTSGDGCSSTCQKESVCGNGVVEPGEQCDDGNTTSGDGCSSTCQIELPPACALIPQGGCSGATPACDLTAADDGTTACRAVTKQGNSNSHCASPTECRIGYTCTADPTSTVEAWCMRYCAHDTDCLGTGSRCVDELDDSHGHPLNLEVCSNACDPYGQSGCPSGLGCLAHDATAGDYTDCHVMGTTADGDTCTSSVDCLAGSTCVAEAGLLSCEPYCHVGNDATCAVGTCVSFVSPIVIGTIEYGTCQ